jgi:anti-sigma regulatory factor (Ser/Thr protein kinase)
MGTPPGALLLPSTPLAAALARQHVQQVGSSWPPRLLDTVVLVVSEAVTNAVRYGLGRIELRVALDDGSVLVEVSDANPNPPTRRPFPPDGLADGGLGLHLLDALTEAWGTQSRHDPPGKTVWLRLPLSA